MSRAATSPTALLLRAVARNATGRLKWDDVEVFLQTGRVVQVTGLPLLSRWLDRAEGEPSNLKTDVMSVAGEGVELIEIWDEAACVLAQALAQTADGKAVGVYEQDVEPPDGGFPMDVPLGPAIRDAYQSARPADLIAQSFERRMDEPLTVRAPDRAERGMLSAGTMRTLKVCNAEGTLTAVVRSVVPEGPVVLERTWLDVDLLFEFGLLAIGKAAAARRRFLRKQQQTKIRQLRARADELERMRPLDALGVKPDSTLELDHDKLGSIFRRVAGAYHPDNYVDQGNQVKRAAAHVFAVLNQHRDDLVQDDALLKDEIDRLRSLGRGEAFVPRVKRDRARVMFRAVQGMENMRRWDEARAKLEKIVEIDPNTLIYQVVLIHIRHILKETDFRTAIHQLEDLALDGLPARCEAAYRAGRILRQAGKNRAARQRFEQVLELNANHIGAKREVRLLERRAQK
ncbi:MAG TPA: hypothetical protein QGF58_24025 [Myxococcota bacterium]|nr:hypothetical protein [Myxococcota bacterium]